MKSTRSQKPLSRATVSHGAFLVAIAILGSPAGAALIDFETINGAVPIEGMAISNQFAPYFGATFRSGSPDKAQPAIARKGAPIMAFGLGNGPAGHDTLSTNEPLAITFGDYFLSDDNVFDGDNKDLVIEFASPVSQVGGYLFDIDGTESVKLIAWANTNATMEVARINLSTNSPGTGSGLATAWSLSSSNRGRIIRRIDIKMNDVAGKANIGFDNFWSDYEPPAVPAPKVNLRLVAGVSIEGEVGKPYRIEYADKLDITPAATNWRVLTAQFFLPTTNYMFIDTNIAKLNRFYRAVALP